MHFGGGNYYCSRKFTRCSLKSSVTRGSIPNVLMVASPSMEEDAWEKTGALETLSNLINGLVVLRKA